MTRMGEKRKMKFKKQSILVKNKTESMAMKVNGATGKSENGLTSREYYGIVNSF